MFKKMIYAFIVLVLVNLMIVNVVFATTMKSNGGGFTVTYPDKVNPLEPIKLHFEVKDKELINNTDFIYGDFSIPLSEGEGFEHKSDLIPMDGHHRYIYNGKKSFDVVISLLGGALDLNNKEDFVEEKDDLETKREFYFLSDKDGDLDSIKIPFKANPYDFDVKNIPAGFIQKKKDLNTLVAMYVKEGDEMSNHLSISVTSYNYNFHDEQKLLSKEEIMNEVPVPDGYTKESFTVNGNPAYLTTSCTITGWDETDEYNGGCWFSGEIFTQIGRLSFDMRRHDSGKPKATIESEVETWKSSAKEGIQNIIMTGGKSSGQNIVKEQKDDLTCYSDSDCYKDESCNACGECAKADKVYSEDEVSLEDVSFKTKFTSKKVLNKIDSLIIARVTPTFKIVNSDGKKINYCDMHQGSFKNLVLHGEIKENNSYSGFTSGMLYDKRDKTRDRNIDLSEPNSKIAFFISPNDREKYVGEIKDIKEHVKFTLLNGNEKLYEDEYEYLLEAYDSNVEIKTNSKQMQQDSSKAIAFKVKNKYAKDVVVKVKLFGIGGIEENEPGFKHTIDNEIVTRKSFFDSFKPNKEYKFAYYSPELGNADIGKSLAGLSMTNLQMQGAKATAIDALSLGLGHGLEKGAKALSAAEKTSHIALEGAKKYFKAIPGAYSADKAAKVVQDLNYVKKFGENFDKVKKLGDAGNQLYGLSQVYGAGSSAVKGYGDLKNPEKIKKSWAEKIGEAGVTGINGLQGAVGGVMLVAGKVPGFGPLAQAIFSATTNIWKANFQYIANSEKIDRIQELFWPNLIMIEASDESGWTARSLIVIKVAYQEI